MKNLENSAEMTDKDKHELLDSTLEGVSGGVHGNVAVPKGYKRVCAECGSTDVHYSVSGGGFPVCFACGSSEYNFVPE